MGKGSGKEIEIIDISCRRRVASRSFNTTSLLAHSPVSINSLNRINTVDIVARKTMGRVSLSYVNLIADISDLP